jgi:hypothetical protein
MSFTETVTIYLLVLRNRAIYATGKAHNSLSVKTDITLCVCALDIFVHVFKSRSARWCLLFCAESLVFQFAIQKRKDYDLQNYDLAGCFVWLRKLVTHIEGGM